jgi:uncharacterized protein with NRDE domain
MCLIGVAHLATARFPLVIAANRDEAFARPAIPAAFWPERPDVLGGRDLVHGGTWLATSRTGRWAAITNLRGADRTPESRSRGELVTGYVESDVDPATYLATVSARTASYGGFHLLAGRAGEIRYFSSAEGSPLVLEAGVHGFSNAMPGVEWEKVDAVRSTIESLLATPRDPESLTVELMAFLTTPSRAAKMLGRTLFEDVSTEPFILGEQYGTRSSTVIVVDGDGCVHFTERTFGPLRSPLGEARFSFEVS